MKRSLKAGLFRRDLNNSAREIDAHLAALEKRKVAEGYAGHFAFLYEALNILDGKASSLLTFNAIGLAALAIWLEKIPLNLFHLALDVAFLLLVVSCGICLVIVSLHWVSTRDLDQAEERPADLLRIRESRTVLFRWAWLLAVLAVCITGLATFHHTVETLLTVYFNWRWKLPGGSDLTHSPGF